MNRRQRIIRLATQVKHAQDNQPINEGDIHRHTNGKNYRKVGNEWQPVGHFGKPLSNEEWGTHSDYIGREPYDLTEYQYSYDYDNASFHEGDYNKNYDTVQAKRREWENSILQAATMGKISPEDAIKRGLYSQYKFQDLPEIMYHVTTAKSKVLGGGKLKSRAELTQEYGEDLMKGGHPGLGGGDDKSISFTEDIGIARDIKKSILELRALLRGGTPTVKQMIDDARNGNGANGPWIDGVEQHLKNSVGLTIQQLLDKKKVKSVDEMGLKRTMMMATDVDYVKEEMPEAVAIEPWMGGDGKLKAGRFLAPLTQEEYGRALYYFYNGWATYREEAGGSINPLFFMTDEEKIKNIPEGEVAIIKVKTLPQAKGTQEGSLGEWRIYTGDAVEVIGEVE